MDVRQGSYTVSLVSTSGSVVATAHAATRTPAWRPGFLLPYVSTTLTRAYYLDRDTTLHFLGPDGTLGIARTLPGGPDRQAGFAVSPDDKRIAVSIIDYGPDPPVVHLSVGPLDGALTEIYSSNGNYVWPIGWHAGEVVLAVGGELPLSQQGQLFLNPYGGRTYHLADAGNADHLGSIGILTCQPSGLINRAGTACYMSTARGGEGARQGLLDWSGRPYGPTVDTPFSVAASVSPEVGATASAYCCRSADGTGSVGVADGKVDRPTALTGLTGDWVCWPDTDHLLSGSVVAGRLQPAVLDLGANRVFTVVGAAGYCAAVLPSDLD